MIFFVSSFFAYMNKAILNIQYRVFFLYEHKFLFCFGKYCGIKLLGWMVSIFLTRDYWTVFINNCTIFCFHQQYIYVCMYICQNSSYCLPYEWVLSGFSHVQLRAMLWTVAWQSPLSVGFSKQAYWNESPCPPPVATYPYFIIS